MPVVTLTPTLLHGAYCNALLLVHVHVHVSSVCALTNNCVSASVCVCVKCATGTILGIRIVKTLRLVISRSSKNGGKISKNVLSFLTILVTCQMDIYIYIYFLILHCLVFYHVYCHFNMPNAKFVAL